MIFNKFLLLPRRQKQIVALVIDVALLWLAFYSALVLRFENPLPPVSPYFWQLFCAPFLSLPFFIKLGLYRAVVRYMEDKVVLVVVVGTSLGVVCLAAFSAWMHTPISRGVFIIYWLLAIVYVGATRFLARAYFLRAERAEIQKRIAIFGAGRAGMQLAYALRASRKAAPVAFFDENESLQKMEVAAIQVFAPQKIVEIIKTKKIDEIWVAIPSASKARRAKILEELCKLPCRVRVMPSVADMAEDSGINAIRDVEIEDLLGRESVVPDESLLKEPIEGKSVLVSGAGGSIGSELCRQILAEKPAVLVLVEQNEFALYAIEKELRQKAGSVEVVAVLGSVLNQERMSVLMRAFAVNVVYHAAAYKHVPLVEHNPVEGLHNNVIGTLRLARAAQKAQVADFVLISTDKAVRPTNIMGASKRLAELVLQALAKTATTRFSMVRFGNVLGSSGSVVPLFREQIAKGGPITLTHPDITRFFMTIPEAVQLVIQAGAMSKQHNETGVVYVLDMGEPIKIYDLALKMLHLSGLSLKTKENPKGDIEIKIIGLRPGEKLFEELLIGENVQKTEHPLIMKASEYALESEELFHKINQMEEYARQFYYEKIIALLSQTVREYQTTRHDDALLLWQTLQHAKNE